MKRALPPLLLGALACAPVEPPGPPGPVCTEATPVSCEEGLFEELSLQEGEVSPQDVENTTESFGFHSAVDARGGGLAADPRQSFLYLRFTDDGLEKVELNDRDALSSMDWDIAFHRYVVRLNGGSSGPSCVAAAPTGTTDFDDVVRPDDGDFATDAQFNEACAFIAELDGESRDPPNERDYLMALGIGRDKTAWWAYEGCVETTGEVFVVRRADASLVKLQITHFYDDEVQEECNETGFSSEGGAANIQLKWTFLPAEETEG